MIIRSLALTSSHQTGSVVPAWAAVENIQKHTSANFRLVTQPDHAHLSGAIAAAFDQVRFPMMTDDIVEAIRLHDEGWAEFEGTAERPRKPAVSHDGKPLTFIDVAPEVFLRAWTGSIAAAGDVSVAGHYIVSSHFRALAEHRLNAVVDPPETAERLTDFAAQQAEHEADLLPRCGRTERELGQAAAALRFCDLMSLVICSGVAVPVELPNDFGIGNIRLEPRDGGYELNPSPLRQPVTLEFYELEFETEPVRRSRVEVRLS